MSDLNEARHEAAAVGLIVDEFVLDGCWHRVPVEGKRKSNLAGAYCLSEFELRSREVVVVGMLTNWVTGAEVSLTLDSVAGASAEEMAEARGRARAAAEASKLEKVRLQEETATRACGIWSKLPAEGSSDYLRRKEVKGWGLRFSRGSVVVPLRDVAGKIWSLQFIDAAGNKRFLTGGAKRGHFHFMPAAAGAEFDEVGLGVLPAQPISMIGIAEGFSTASSVFEALSTEVPTAVAFDAGNLLPVAQALRERYPKAALVVFADDDCHGGYPQAFIRRRDLTPAVRALLAKLSRVRPDVATEVVDDDDSRLRDPKKTHNVGVAKAVLAAAAVGGFVIMPRFINSTGAAA